MGLSQGGNEHQRIKEQVQQFCLAAYYSSTVLQFRLLLFLQKGFTDAVLSFCVPAFFSFSSLMEHHLRLPL